MIKRRNIILYNTHIKFLFIAVKAKHLTRNCCFELNKIEYVYKLLVILKF